MALSWCSGNEVHPYHLLRYDRVIFSQPAIEKLQVSLKNASSKRRQQEAEGEAPKKQARAPRSAPGMKKRRRWPDEIRTIRLFAVL